VIRDACASDAEALAALYVELLRESVAPATVRDAIADAEGSQSSRILVYEADGRVVGTAHVLFYLSPLRPTAGKGVVDAVVIADGHRGRGIGAALVQRAQSWLSERGASPVFVSTRWDRTVAHEMYASQGWRPWGLTYARFDEG
jgi:GNAT superfamily N-acetyltransferase